MEEKFRKAMVQNAQSDNEKASLVYQVELFKDKLEDMEEAYALLQVCNISNIIQIWFHNKICAYVLLLERAQG